MIHFLLAGFGGFVGAAGRHGLHTLTHRLAGGSVLPWGTLVVNLVGCLLIGVLAGLAEARSPLSEEARVLLMVGVLGGFSTFSAFGLETLQLVRTGMPALAALNIAAQVVVCIGAVWGGLVLGRSI